MTARVGRTRAASPLGRSWAVALCLLAVGASGAPAQQLEPRAYSPAPVGLNFLIAGYVHTEGPVSFDPAVPIDDAELRTNSAVMAYARVLDVWGRTGKFDVIVPYVWLEGDALVNGERTGRRVDGMADPLFRLSVNFYGAPALSAEEFAGYRQDLSVGGSLQVTPPLGQYDDTRIVNIGNNRWSYKPEVGVSKAWGSWVCELLSSVTFYQDNDDFRNGGKLEQDPLYAVQAHVIRLFPRGIWAALNGTFYRGGRTTVNGEKGDNLQSATRAGLTVALPVTRNHSLKLYGSTGTSSRTGSSFDAVGAAWQYRWGGGV